MEGEKPPLPSAAIASISPHQNCYVSKTEAKRWLHKLCSLLCLPAATQWINNSHFS